MRCLCSAIPDVSYLSAIRNEQHFSCTNSIIILKLNNRVILTIFILLFFQNGLLLCCDWQLKARTLIWQNEMGGQTVTSNFLSGCQRDLNSLRRVSDGMPVNILSMHCPNIKLIIFKYVHIICNEFIFIDFSGQEHVFTYMKQPFE